MVLLDLLLSAPALPVDVQDDRLDITVDIAGVVGAFAAVVAIWIARRAERKADETVTQERRRVFELEVLRDLMKELSDPGFIDEFFYTPDKLQRFEFQMSLLQSPPEFWVHLARLRRMEDVIHAVGLGVEYDAAVVKLERLNQEMAVFEGGPTVIDDAGETRPNVKFGKLLTAMQRAEKRKDDVKALARDQATTKLAWDIQQGVHSNVLAGHQPRRTLYQRWWYGC